jgi:hypothetical protein
MEDKYEVVRSENGGCYVCCNCSQELYLARDISTGQLTAVCSHCLLDRLDCYEIDNTRTWPVICDRNPG